MIAKTHIVSLSQRPQRGQGTHKTENKKGSKEQLMKGYSFSMPRMNNLGRESDQAGKRKIFFLGAGPATVLLQTSC